MSETETDPAAGWDRKFYDSAAYQFPAGATHIMAYADGRYSRYGSNPPPADLADRYPFIHWITILGGTGPVAVHAQFADYEQDNPVHDVPGNCRRWVEARVTRGLRAIPYCDRADLHALHNELGPTLWTHELVRFWIPTLDNHQWTPAELSMNIAQNWGAFIPAGRLWANQYAGQDSGSGGDWDTSNLFGTWNR